MMTRKKLAIRTRRALRQMTPRHVIKTRMTRKVMETFADKVGMVYFGYVDQKHDEHKLIRGHTVSSTHVDDHYCVGSFQGYDVALVARNDVVVSRSPTTRPQSYHWLICTVDVHTEYELPHVYIGHRSREESYTAAYKQLHTIELGSQAIYPIGFLNEYHVYGLPGESIEIEQTIPPHIADVILQHFSGASIEIENNTIYLYIESQHPSEVLLEKMLSNCLWLAEAIDAIYAPQINKEN
jgi:hypothetical protein